MAAKVTIQDIADELGLSRNTVSKAINNTGILSESTKARVLQKAAEMGYKHFSYMNADTFSTPAQTNKEIALITTSPSTSSSHFASTLFDYFQNEFGKLGYHLSCYILSKQDIFACKLPHNLNQKVTDGIIIIEMFDLAYSLMLCGLGIPTLFVDSHANPMENGIMSDFLYMENTHCIYHLMKHLKEKGYTRFGFIGAAFHCHSFYERYIAFRRALELLGLDYQPDSCMLAEPGNLPDPEFLKKTFHSMASYPEVFFCANDFIAVDFLQVSREAGFSVPKDFLLCGFDDSPESNIVTPKLTTVHIHSQIMGLSALQLLMSRIKEPNIHYRIIHTETSIRCRASTNDEAAL